MPAQKFTIQGRVIDSETRQGLAIRFKLYPDGFLIANLRETQT